MKKNRLTLIFDHMEEVILVALFALMVAIIFIQIVMRYAFNDSLSWSEELGRYIFVWLTWLGISIGAREGEHIKISILTDRLPFRAANAMNIVSEVLVIVICAITVYYGIVMSQMLLGLDAKSAVLHVSQVWGHAAVPVGCGLMILRCLQSICRSVRNLRYGPEAEEKEEAAAAEAETETEGVR